MVQTPLALFIFRRAQGNTVTRMDDWYEAPDFKCDQLLDELMCEYVDGTMDPSVRSAFDELVETNPEIAAQIKGLTEAQYFLSRSGCCCSVSAPLQFQSRLRARLNAETGKIDVYGLPESQNESRPLAKYVILAVVVVWAGIVLPRHDYSVEVSPLANEIVDVVASADLPFMTPAVRPSNLFIQTLSVAGEPLRVPRTMRSRSHRLQTAEAELTSLTD